MPKGPFEPYGAPHWPFQTQEIVLTHCHGCALSWSHLYPPLWSRQARSSHHQIVIWIWFWFWDECGDPLRAGAESLKSPSSIKICCKSRFFYGLALPHMSINFWICFWGIQFTFQQLRRTFLPAFLFSLLLKFGGRLPLVRTNCSNLGNQ